MLNQLESSPMNPNAFCQPTRNRFCKHERSRYKTVLFRFSNLKDIQYKQLKKMKREKLTDEIKKNNQEDIALYEEAKSIRNKRLSN